MDRCLGKLVAKAQVGGSCSQSKLTVSVASLNLLNQTSGTVLDREGLTDLSELLKKL